MRRPQYYSKLQLVIDSCIDVAPKKMCGEAVKHHNMIINNGTDLPTGARDALSNYLFIGEPNLDGSIEDEHVQFIMHVKTGQVCLDCAVFMLFAYHIFLSINSFHLSFDRSYDSQSMCLR